MADAVLPRRFGASLSSFFAWTVRERMNAVNRRDRRRREACDRKVGVRPFLGE